MLRMDEGITASVDPLWCLILANLFDSLSIVQRVLRGGSDSIIMCYLFIGVSVSGVVGRVRFDLIVWDICII